MDGCEWSFSSTQNSTSRLVVDGFDSDSSTVISIGTTVCMVGSDESLNLNYSARYEYRYVQYLLNGSQP